MPTTKECWRDQQYHAEHTWENQHTIDWKVTVVMDQAKGPKELLLKEVLVCIQMALLKTFQT